MRRAAGRLAHRRRQLVAGRLPRPAAGLVRRRAGAGHGPQGRRHADRQPARPRDHRDDRQSARRSTGPGSASISRSCSRPGRWKRRRRRISPRSMPRRPRRRTRWCGRSPTASPTSRRSRCARRWRRWRGWSRRSAPRVRIVALITLAAGVLVLGGAVAAGHRRRVYDAVVLKVLGATRGAVGAAFLVEYGLLGVADRAGRGRVRHARRLCALVTRRDAQRSGCSCRCRCLRPLRSGGAADRSVSVLPAPGARSAPSRRRCLRNE